MRHRPTFGLATRPTRRVRRGAAGRLLSVQEHRARAARRGNITAAVGPLSGRRRDGRDHAAERDRAGRLRRCAATTVDPDEHAPRRALLGTGGCIDPTPSTAAVFFEPATGTKDALSARALVLANPTPQGGDREGRRDRHVAQAARRPGGRRRCRSESPRPISSWSPPTPTPGRAASSDQIVWEIAASDCFAQPVYDAVKNAAVAALTQANAARQPAEHRDRHQHRDRREPATGSRRRPSVDARARPDQGHHRRAGAPIAALFNFAVHGTSHGAGNMQFSADCMGAMEDQVETKHSRRRRDLHQRRRRRRRPDAHQRRRRRSSRANSSATRCALMWPGLTSLSVDRRSARRASTIVTMPAPQYNPNGCLPLADGGRDAVRHHRLAGHRAAACRAGSRPRCPSRPCASTTPCSSRSPASR